MMTAEEFQRTYDEARYPDLPAALVALNAAECEEPICAVKIGSTWCLMLVRAVRCLKRLGMDWEVREKPERVGVPGYSWTPPVDGVGVLNIDPDEEPVP